MQIFEARMLSVTVTRRGSYGRILPTYECRACSDRKEAGLGKDGSGGSYRVKKTESKNSSGSSVELCHVEGPGKIFLLFQASTLADTGSSQTYARFWVPILIRRLAF